MPVGRGKLLRSIVGIIWKLVNWFSVNQNENSICSSTKPSNDFDYDISQLRAITAKLYSICLIFHPWFKT